jgi:2-polyprenyl-6-methoxyphenol hydroxylase-like FAD-dependent oxidoreductase
VNVAIVGGSFAGLAAAIGLRRAGVSATVHERASSSPAPEGVVQIWANGMRALRQLGVVDRVRDAAVPLEVESFRSWRGRELFRVPQGEFARRNGIDTSHFVRRGDLLAILADALEPGTIRYSDACAGFEDDGTGVTLDLASGRARADALVGADGIDSTVRASLHPDSRPQPAGYRHLEGVARFDVEPGLLTYTWGQGDRFGLHSAGDGLAHWFGIVLGEEERDPKREATDRFAGFPDPIPALIAATPAEAITATSVRHLEPLAEWGAGRVTLIGDAAHAMTPDTGRGIGEALEDAVALGDALAAAAGDVPAALRAYEDARRTETAAVQKHARQIGALASWRGPKVRIRELLMRGPAGRSSVKTTAREFESLATSVSTTD